MNVLTAKEFLKRKTTIEIFLKNRILFNLYKRKIFIFSNQLMDEKILYNSSLLDQESLNIENAFCLIKKNNSIVASIIEKFIIEDKEYNQKGGLTLFIRFYFTCDRNPSILSEFTMYKSLNIKYEINELRDIDIFQKIKQDIKTAKV